MSEELECQNCYTINPLEGRFCTRCGGPLTIEGVNKTDSRDFAPTTPRRPVYFTSKPKTNYLVYVIAAIVLVILVVVVILFRTSGTQTYSLLPRTTSENTSTKVATQTSSNLFGTYNHATGFGDCLIKLKSDYTGECFEVKLDRWQKEGENGFSATMIWERNPRRLFGHLTPSGDLLVNFEPVFGSFGKTETTLYKRIE